MRQPPLLLLSDKRDVLIVFNSVSDAQYDLNDPTMSKAQKLAHLRDKVMFLGGKIKVCLELQKTAHS